MYCPILSYLKSTLEESVVSIVWNSTVLSPLFLSQLVPPVLMGIFLSGHTSRSPGDTHVSQFVQVTEQLQNSVSGISGLPMNWGLAQGLKWRQPTSLPEPWLLFLFLDKVTAELHRDLHCHRRIANLSFLFVFLLLLVFKTRKELVEMLSTCRLISLVFGPW